MERPKVLIVDDDPSLRDLLGECLAQAGLDPSGAATAEEALGLLEKELPAAVLADLKMPGEGGLWLLAKIKDRWPHLPVVILTGYGSVDVAVEAMKAGASDFLLKPCSPQLLVKVLKKALSCVRPQAIIPEAPELLTNDPKMFAILERVKMVAESKATVLIQGESGTGKELIACLIHRLSDRRKGPFVAINCAAIPENLLEAELFGYEKGAFTGANARKPGKFELAHQGTLLLDEVSEMALPLQAKLLRVLQEGEIDRIGGREPVKVDVRIVATTNRDMESYVREGHFREDLFFRLNVIPLKIPPLRERRGDIRLLAEHFARQFSGFYGRPFEGFAPGVLEVLEGLPWPGNVRELKNVIERAVLLSKEGVITLGALFPDEEIPRASGQPAEGQAPPLKTLKELEQEMIIRALEASGGNRTKAAEILGISVRTLRNKLQGLREMGLNL
ncbi:sigma-54-dependent transcriptional regulator [Thermosulfuriphilus sp.]